MSQIIYCPGCRQKLQADEKLFGKKVKCPKCKSPIEVPSPPDEDAALASDISDLLDDALTVPPKEASPAPEQSHVPKCSRCGDELTEGSRYCVVCGHNNVDGDGAMGKVAMDFDKRQQRLEAMQRPRHWLWSALLFWH